MKKLQPYEVPCLEIRPCFGVITKRDSKRLGIVISSNGYSYRIFETIDLARKWVIKASHLSLSKNYEIRFLSLSQLYVEQDSQTLCAILEPYQETNYVEI